MEGKESHYSPLVGRKTAVVTMEISVEVSQKAKNWTSILEMTQLYHFRFVNTSKDSISYRDTNLSMFIAVLFVIARKWNQPMCLSTKDWVMKMWYIYRMKLNSTVKENKVWNLQKHEWNWKILHDINPGLEGWTLHGISHVQILGFYIFYFCRSKSVDNRKLEREPWEVEMWEEG